MDCRLHTDDRHIEQGGDARADRIHASRVIYYHKFVVITWTVTQLVLQWTEKVMATHITPKDFFGMRTGGHESDT